MRDQECAVGFHLLEHILEDAFVGCKCGVALCSGVRACVRVRLPCNLKKINKDEKPPKLTLIFSFII